MNPLSRSQWAALTALLAVLYLTAAAVVMRDYGPTWDCAMGEYHHGERYLAFWSTFDRSYLDFNDRSIHLTHRQPHLDDGVDWMPWNQSYPFAATLSALSCRVLWTGLGLGDAAVAHHVVVALFTVLLIGLLVGLAGRLTSAVAAVGAVAALLLSPRFFAHSMNNLKDVPEAALYVLALVALFEAMSRDRRVAWAVGGVLGGLAMAQKPNAMFLPPHAFSLLLMVVGVRLVKRERLPRPWAGIAIAAVTFVIAWFAASPMLWDEPLLRLAQRYAFVFDVATTPGDADWSEGLRAVWHTTPPAILALAFVGLFHPSLDAERRGLLVLGAAVPLLRTMLPGAVNFDGVRHFLEFYPFVAWSAGLGLDLAARLFRRLTRASVAPSAVVVGALLFASPLYQTVTLHPNGICYFNAMIGGLSGAQRRGVPESTDYWANSYAQGLRWLRDHGEPGAAVIVPIAEHVAACGAPLYLGDGGPRLADPYNLGDPPAVYVMFITRRNWYDDVVRAAEKDREAIHEIRVQGAAVLRIFRVDPVDEMQALHRLWSETRACIRLGVRMFGHPRATEVHLLLRNAPQLGFDRAVAGLRATVPDWLHPEIEPAVRFMLRRAAK